MASVTQLGYVGIGASNLEEWEHFATDVLGLQSNGIDDDGNLSLRMDEYSHRFIIKPNGKDDIEFVGWQASPHSGRWPSNSVMPASRSPTAPTMTIRPAGSRA